MTTYDFRRAFSALFLAEYEALHKLLPPDLWPLEAQRGFGVLAVTAFDFTDSEVGAYGELVCSVLVPPWAPRGTTMADTAYYPFFLATSTEASRTHAAERWRLPAHARCLDIAFSGDDRQSTVSASEGGTPVLSLSVGLEGGAHGIRTYQCFSSDAQGLYRVTLDIEGDYDEHEEELGLLTPGAHPLGQLLDELAQDLVPFREQSLARGQQRFGALLQHGRAS